MINEMISVDDELRAFAQKAKENNFHIQKIEKIGNANMSAFRAYYRKGNETTDKELFFWRHDMDKLLQQMEQAALIDEQSSDVNAGVKGNL